LLELLGLLLIVALAAQIWAVRRTESRLRLLAEFTRALEREEELPPLPAPGAGNLGRLQAVLARAADQLRERLTRARGEEHRLQAVLGGMVEGVLVIDSAGTVLLGNRRAEYLLDLHADMSKIGRPLIELTRNPDLHELVRWARTAGGAATPLVREVTLGGPNPHILQVTATPVEAAATATPAFILVFHDISELKRLERIRRDFVANVSHELRTPLAAIGGYTETLLSGALDDQERARRFLAIIERHTERLGRLVDDLLILSDLELGRTELRRTAVEAESIIETTFEVVRHKAGPAGITLEQQIAPDTPLLNADEDRVHQALLNLVDNSIKYTPRGGHVTVSARLMSEGEALDNAADRDGAYVEIAVVDTGVGVPPEDLPRLTERFYRVDKARSRELGGTGLGLAIVKHIVQAHGGWMRIESQLNKGTTVRLFLPSFRAAAEKERAAG
jgi:two-component system, OmpR family, phosphate regulon sensor histidine kinase PhoR